MCNTRLKGHNEFSPFFAKKFPLAASICQKKRFLPDLDCLKHLLFSYLSLVVRKPVFMVSDQVQHKPGCTATEDG